MNVLLFVIRELRATTLDKWYFLLHSGFFRKSLVIITFTYFNQNKFLVLWSGFDGSELNARESLDVLS